MKNYIYLVLVFMLSSVAVLAQNITKVINYDFKTGKLSTDDKEAIATKDHGRNTYRLGGLTEGQAVVFMVHNINPLKYTCNVNGVAQTIFTAPPDLKAPDINALSSLELPAMTAAAAKTAATENKATPKVATGKNQFSEFINLETTHKPDPCIKEAANTALIKTKVDAIIGAVKAIREMNEQTKAISSIFISFNDYIKRASTLDNLDEVTFKSELDRLVTDKLHNLQLTDGTTSNLFQVNANVTSERMSNYKDYILSEYKKQQKIVEDNYDELYDLVLEHKVAAQCLGKTYNDSKMHTLELVLTGLPDTKKEYFKLHDWIETSYTTISQQLWPDILKSVDAFGHYYALSFDIHTDTFMAQKDLLVLDLSIKTVADQKEVRKIEKIGVYTNGGIKIDYGVGLYMTGLGDDEFVTTTSERIENIAYIKDDKTVDSALKTVTHSTLHKSSKTNFNWGVMAFIQARSNWDRLVNVGGYIGLGVISNNESRPVCSFGGSIIFGRLQRASLNLGVAFGRVQRLNPKYAEGKEYSGIISDPTVNIIDKSYLIGFHWKIGTFN